MELTKEADLNDKKSVIAGIPKSLFNLNQEEFVDGLVKFCDNDEELALRTLNAHADKINDGLYNNAKNKLEKMIESSKKLSFREKCQKIIEANKAPRPKDLADPSIYYGYKNAVSDEELTQLIKYGIHPNLLYSKRFWRYETKNGDKIVFQLQGIDKKDLNSGNVKVIVKGIGENEETGNEFIMDKEVMNMPAKRFVQIVKSPLNADIYNHLMKGESEDPADWAMTYGIAKTNMRTAFAQWYEQNKNAYDFDDYDKFRIQDVYKLTKQGYTIPQAMRRVKLESVDEEEEVLTEVEKMDINKDPKTVRQTLEYLDINPKFMTLPFKVVDHSNLPEDDKEPTRNYIIAGIQDGKLNNPEYIFVRDYDNGGKAVKIPTSELISLLKLPENQNPKLDLWDKASSIRKQNMAMNVGNEGKFHELTRDEVLAALDYIQKDERYKDIDLKDLYLKPQTFETRNLLVVKALKDVDPRYQVKAIKTSKGLNGISYQIFIPDWDFPKTKPSSTGYKFSNPYKQVTKDWFNN